MKPLFSCFLFFGFTCFATAQVPFEYVFQQAHSSFVSIDINEQEQIAIGGTTGACIRSKVALFNTDGSLQWEKEKTKGISNVSSLFFDAQARINIFGISKESDAYSSSSDGIYFMQLDTLGEVLVDQIIPYSFDLEEGSKVTGIKLQNQNFLIAFQNQFFELNKIGQLLANYEFPLAHGFNFSGLGQSSNGDIFSLDQNNIYLLSYQDKEILQSYQSTDQLLSYVLQGDTIWVLGQEKLYLFEGDLENNLVYSIPEGLNLKGLSLNQQGELVFWNEQQSIFYFKEALWEEHQLPIDPNATILDLKEINGHFFMTGQDQWEEENSFGPAIGGAFLASRSLNDASSTVVQNDIAVLDVQIIEQTPIDTFDLVRAPDADTILAYGIQGEYLAELTIANKGTSDVNSLNLFSNSRGSTNCDDFRMFWAEKGLGIHPGSQPNFSVFFNYQTYVQANTKTSIKHCFSVAVPNNRFDEDQSNNQFCSVLITSTTQKHVPNEFSIFPNPANTQLQIRSINTQSLQAVSLYDTQGRSIPINWSTTASGVQVETSTIRNGLYFLKIQSPEGISTQNIVIQH